MPILTEQDVRERARRALRSDQVQRKACLPRDSREILRDLAGAPKTQYDIFVCHSTGDADLLLGIRGVLEDLGYTPYIDWDEEAEPGPAAVTPETTERRRAQLQTAHSLLYVAGGAFRPSCWLPWELGYFEGLREKVAILPVKDYVTDAFDVGGYLSIYPYCLREQNQSGQDTLWVHKDSVHYVAFDHWLGTRNAQLAWRK